MEKLKAVLKKLFLPPTFLTIILAVLGYGFVLVVALLGIKDPVIRVASYLASAYALTLTITRPAYCVWKAGGIRKYVAGLPLAERIKATKIGERFLTDVRFREGTFLYKGFFINLLYIIMKLVSGIVYRSPWFIALAVYYILLAVMRFLLVRRMNAQDMFLEWRRYRLCGIMLFLMNQALAGIVVFVVQQNKGFDYPGFLIYAMAAYAFYAIITASVNLFKARRHQSPVISAAKAINLVAAMVSILSLETALLAQFGGDDDPLFRQVMTGATGGAVCTIVIGMGIYMICRANKNLKRIEKEL